MNHQTEGQMPMPDGCDTIGQQGYEKNVYRAKAGTYIAIRLNPGKLGTLNLCDAVLKYLCGAKVPVYIKAKKSHEGGKYVNIGENDKFIKCSARKPDRNDL